ncbi:MAG: DUF2079 domain-containing protein [Anaerolineae bacterium]|nr:DUF2079 domain-containing protein [Anaerolineae bacterium]
MTITALVLMAGALLVLPLWLATVNLTPFNSSLVAEVRAGAALLGVLLLLVAWLTPQITALASRLTAPLAAAERWLAAGRRWWVLLLTATALMAILLAAYSITRHNHFNSKAYDLGLHAQVTWNSSHGRLFAGSVEVDNYLGDHVSPVILLLAPLYRLFPDPRMLLAVQAAALALGALPLALLARRRLTVTPHFLSLILALIFLTYPALGFVNRFEYHEEVLVVPLLLAAFLALDARRAGWMSLALALALLCKEDIGLTVAAFGLFAWWQARFIPGNSSQRRLKMVGLLWAAGGLVWSLLALLVIIPAFRSAPSDTLTRYSWLLSGPADVLGNPARIVQHLLADPRRLWMLIKFLLPVGFTSLLSPAILVSLPALAVNWLAGNLYQSSIYFHYAAATIPVVFAAAVHGTERLIGKGEKRGKDTETEGKEGNTGAAEGDGIEARAVMVVAWLLLCALLALSFDQFWQPRTGQANWENYGLAWQVSPESVAAFEAAAALLPADGALATTEAYASHLANREGLYLLHDPRIPEVADRVEWVLVDLNDHRYGVRPRQYYGLLRWIADMRGLSVCYFSQDVVLLGTGCDDPVAARTYETRLSDLQQEAAGEEVNDTLLKLLGPSYFR